jgi:hypothetical protein
MRIAPEKSFIKFVQSLLTKNYNQGYFDKKFGQKRRCLFDKKRRSFDGKTMLLRRQKTAFDEVDKKRQRNS